MAAAVSLSNERGLDLRSKPPCSFTRSRIRDVESVFVVPSEIDVDDRTSTEISGFIVNDDARIAPGQKQANHVVRRIHRYRGGASNEAASDLRSAQQIAADSVLSTVLHFVPKNLRGS